MVKHSKALRARSVYVARSKLRLIDLLRDGVSGISFTRLGSPFYPRKASGYKAVRVKAKTGAVSTLLYEAQHNGMISGLLKLG